MNDFVSSDAIWQLFLNFTRSGVVEVNFVPRQIRYSAALADLIKLTSETMPQTFEQWFELYHPDDYSKSLTFRRNLFESTQTTFSLERRLCCGDAQYRWFRMDAFCTRNETGEIERLIGVETDLSPQKNYERQLINQISIVEELRKKLAATEKQRDQLTAELLKKDAHHETLSEKLNNRLHLAMQMLNATSDFAYYYDGDGRLVLCNEACTKAMALNPDLPIRLSEAGRGIEEYDDAYGRRRRVSTRIYPFSNYYGKIEGHVGISSDITEIDEMKADAAYLKRLLWRKIFFQEDSVDNNFPDPLEKQADFVSGSCSLTSDFGSSTSGSGSLTSGSGSSTSDQEGCDLLDSKEILGGYLNGAFRSLAATDLFATRTSQLETLLNGAGRVELEVGIVGITSSGKSSLINALMGERLLPEETRATTNLVVRCRKGSERSVIVVAKDGGRTYVSGQQLTSAWMETLTSERLNPSNKLGIDHLEWTNPGAALPEGLVLIDTPGLDACAFPEHSELVLRQLLPSLDIVLYITSIRNRFKTADIELLEAVLEQDQRVVFLLSQIDLEQDDTEGGKVVLSRQQKLFAYVRELREDIERGFLAGPSSASSPFISKSSIIPVSSKLALAHFYDRESSGWRASNFAPLIKQLEIFQANLSQYRTESRGRRALTLLSRTALDLELALGSVSTEKVEAEGTLRLQKIRELRDAQRWVNAEVSAVRNEWRRQLDSEKHYRQLALDLDAIHTVKGIKNHYEQWGRDWMGLNARMMERMDRSRTSCRDTLHKYGIIPRDRTQDVPEMKGELPVFYRYVRHETREIQVRGWFEDLQFWPRYKTFFRQDVDREKMLEAAKEILSERLRLLNEHLSWWENKMRQDYCEPLYEELAREEVALADIRRAITDISVSRSALRQAQKGIKEAERGIGNMIFSLSVPDDNEAHLEDLLFKTEELQGDPQLLEEEEQGIFAPLLAAFHEQNIQTRFLELDAVRQNRRIVLLGLRRHDSLGLLSRLAHDTFLTESLSQDGKEIDERDWIFCGTTPPAVPHLNVAVPDTLLRELEVLIAPGDTFCSSTDVPEVDWHDLFAEWLPVVHLDIARIDSGLSDLARAPYGKALAYVDHMVIASGNGALFNSRLSDLLTDVPQRVKDFTRLHDYKADVNWFVYENYDARYTDFLMWGQDSTSGSNDESLIDRWITNGHDFKPPFSEHRLRLALEGARRKGRRSSGCVNLRSNLD